MNYIITEEELTSLEKTGNPSYRKSVEYVIGRIRSRPEGERAWKMVWDVCENIGFKYDTKSILNSEEQVCEFIKSLADYRTKYESLRSQVGEVADRVYNCIYERSLFPLYDIADKLDKLAKGE